MWTTNICTDRKRDTQMDRNRLTDRVENCMDRRMYISEKEKLGWQTYGQKEMGKQVDGTDLEE